MNWRVLKILIFCMAMGGVQQASAQQCSPGIPCTSYAKDTGATNLYRGDAGTCNGDVMNQMMARAYLEAQRATLLNETYIRKADSVLEYTCFDQFAQMTAERAGPLFSETQEFRKLVPLNIVYEEAADGSYQNNPSMTALVTSMGSGHMMPNMQAVVVRGLQGYIDTNFGHEFLGGDGGADFDPAAGSNVNYICGNMDLVFTVARCANLPNDPFPTFESLINDDPRQLPEACSGGTNITQSIIDVYKNEAPNYQYAGFDVMEVHWDMFEIEGGGCPAAPIPTGLMATIYQGETVAFDPANNPAGYDMTITQEEEHVCPNPGCWYDPGGNDPFDPNSGPGCRN